MYDMKDFDKVREQFLNNAKHSSSMMGNWIFALSGSKEPLMRTGAGCYGGTSTSHGRGNIVAFYDWAMQPAWVINQGKVFPDEARFYMNWVLNESPYSYLFPEKDVDKVFHEGTFMNLEASPTEIVAGCMTLRSTWYNQANTRLFYEMCKAYPKISPTILSVMMNFISGISPALYLFGVPQYGGFARPMPYNKVKPEDISFNISNSPGAPIAISTSTMGYLWNSYIDGVVSKHLPLPAANKVNSFVGFSGLNQMWDRDYGVKVQIEKKTGFTIHPMLTAAIDKRGRYVGERPSKIENVPAILKSLFNTEF